MGAREGAGGVHGHVWPLGTWVPWLTDWWVEEVPPEGIFHRDLRKESGVLEAIPTQ